MLTGMLTGVSCQALSELSAYLQKPPAEDSPPLPKECYRFIGTRTLAIDQSIHVLACVDAVNVRRLSGLPCSFHVADTDYSPHAHTSACASTVACQRVGADLGCFAATAPLCPNQPTLCKRHRFVLMPHTRRSVLPQPTISLEMSLLTSFML